MQPFLTPPRRALTLGVLVAAFVAVVAALGLGGCAGRTTPMAHRAAARTTQLETIFVDARGGARHPQRSVLHLLAQVHQKGPIVGKLEAAGVITGYRAEVETAASTEAALARLDAFRANVLVSDLSMPGRDGYELIRAVRINQSAESLPAAALTAFARPEDAVRAHDAGFQMHLAKPVEPEELARIVAQLAGRA